MNHSTTAAPTDDSRATRQLTAAFEALRTERRRAILRWLADRERVEIATLATEVAARVPADAEPFSDHQRTVEVALRHVDLPKLSDVGFVEYDPGAGTVRTCPTPTLSSLLALIADVDARTDADPSA